MSQLMDECKKNDLGIIGVLIKWLLIGGPQRKPGKPQKTFGFRLLWFITVVPLLFMAICFFCSKDGNISTLNADVQQYFYIASGVFVVDIILWIIRGYLFKKKKNAPPQATDD